MGLFERLIGGSASKPKPESAADVVRDGRWLHVGDESFCQYKISANGMFVFGWSDSHMEEIPSGHTRNVPGRYVLLEREKVILSGDMPRPNDGHVANNGTFAVCDWMFTSERTGTFKVIDKHGNQRISHLFQANLNKCEISDNGQFAACQTCMAESSDGNKLSFFDVASGNLLWKIDPPIGWADSYKFDVEKKLLYSCHLDKGDFAYSFSGEFLDAVLWREALLTKGRGCEVSGVVNESLAEAKKAGTTPDYASLLAALEQARIRSQDDHPDMRAQIERAIAEIHDAQDNISEAIQHYDMAITFNPKVGVRRRLDALRKRGIPKPPKTP